MNGTDRRITAARRAAVPGRSAAPATVAIGLGALALSAWEGTLVQSSARAHASVLAVIGVTLATAALVGRRQQRQRSTDLARRAGAVLDPGGGGQRPAALVVGTVAWVVLVAATIGWDLNSFVHQAHDLPTLSRLVGDVTRHDWGRALVFAAWLALGTYLAMGGRRRAGARRAARATRAGPGATGAGRDTATP